MNHLEYYAKHGKFVTGLNPDEVQEFSDAVTDSIVEALREIEFLTIDETYPDKSDEWKHALFDAVTSEHFIRYTLSGSL